MSFSQSRLTDLQVIRALNHNAALRADVVEFPDVDINALFPAEKPKRHKWGAEKFSGSFVQHARVAGCVKCGLERHRQYDYGNHRTVFRDPKTDKWTLHKYVPEYSAPTPPCG